MRLLAINTNKGKHIEGGFQHTIYDCGHVNGKIDKRTLYSCKFLEIIPEEFVGNFVKDPEKFMKELDS